MRSTIPDIASHSDLTIRSVNARVVKVPLRFTLGTSAAAVRAVPIVLVDVLTDQGVVGRAYAFGYTDAGAAAIASLLREAVELIRGTAAAPLPVAEGLARRYRLLGVTGAVRMALSTLDMALWDAQAIARHLPLWELLGAERPKVAAYDSRGLGLMAPGPLVHEALRLIDDTRLPAVKLRLGYPTLAEDMAALEAVLRVLPAGIDVMVDYNQALSPDEARRRATALDGHGLLWIEEPIRHDDYSSQALLAAGIRTPLQIGENFNGTHAMKTAMEEKACDYVMPDVARIGGVTGWLQAAAMAASWGVRMSSHLYPEVSLALLGATPTAHWLEYVDWAAAFLEDPLRIVNGRAEPSATPGIGLTWDEDRIMRL